MVFRKNLHDQVTHLFFSHKNSYELLHVNSQTFIIDCTYKTNWYKLPLLIINDVTPINTTFYITFAFQVKEIEEHYTFMMNHLKALLISLDLLNPHVILTDCEEALMNSLSAVYLHMNNLICLWHVNKNVLTYIKKDTTLSTQEYKDACGKRTSEVKEALNWWHTVLYSSTEEAFHDEWASMRLDYITHPGFINYLSNAWLKHAQKIIKCYTNHICHLGNTTTSHGKGGHWGLKFCLMGSQGDLDHVVDIIETKTMNQIRNYCEKVAQQHNWQCFSHQHPIYWEVIAHIMPYVLDQVVEQRKKLMKPLDQQKSCTESFTTSMGLPCSHHL